MEHNLHIMSATISRNILRRPAASNYGTCADEIMINKDGNVIDFDNAIKCVLNIRIDQHEIEVF